MIDPNDMDLNNLSFNADPPHDPFGDDWANLETEIARLELDAPDLELDDLDEPRT